MLSLIQRSSSIIRASKHTPHVYRQLRYTRSTSAASPSDVQPKQSNGEHDPLPVDGLPRYPNATTLGTLRLFDYVGTASFAYSGSLLAAASGMDALGCSLVGAVTAVGGGTIRDAIIINAQPFWTSEPEYLYISLLTGGATFFAMLQSNRQHSAQGNNDNDQVADKKPINADKESRLEVAIDALGVGAFCVIGAQNGIRARFGPLVCVVCGMATATFGGVVRDLLCRRQVRILHSSAEIYATTAAAGAATYVLARRLRAPVFQRVFAGVGVAVALRAWAWTHGIRLPVWPTREMQPALKSTATES